MIWVSFAVAKREVDEVVDAKTRCTFCVRRLAEIEGQLIVGPGVSICGRCADRCVRELRRARVDGWRPFWDPRRPVATNPSPPEGPYRTGEPQSCSFCRKTREADTICGEHASICGPCVQLVLDIREEELQKERE